MYYGTKYQRGKSLMHMNTICESLEISAANDCFKALIRYMGEKFCRKPSSNMCDLLSSNVKAVDAKAVIVERFPEFLSKDSLPWCIFTVAILLSETVWDVFHLYKCLFHSKSDCSLPDVTDAMYCIATFLLYFRDTYRINPGLHYRVYYSLYLIENSSPDKPIEGSQTLKVVSGLPGQQSIHSYSESSSSKLTYEQMKILNHRLQPRQIIKIIALAGKY
ncbi:F-box DNA helicase 1-like [Stegodyphus dumicola]|uniref:F-box DNA helicase 1-like n=1 Tax=Stegodyphus dumicola TaxID=202533 RepID=UPI0015AB3F65|nr:F-box DNA helicase 1-like [Stegodyphus dumicola]